MPSCCMYFYSNIGIVNYNYSKLSVPSYKFAKKILCVLYNVFLKYYKINIPFDPSKNIS